jgi:hypothetical protein
MLLFLLSLLKVQTSYAHTSVNGIATARTYLAATSEEQSYRGKCLPPMTDLMNDRALDVCRLELGPGQELVGFEKVDSLEPAAVFFLIADGENTVELAPLLSHPWKFYSYYPMRLARLLKYSQAALAGSLAGTTVGLIFWNAGHVEYDNSTGTQIMNDASWYFTAGTLGTMVVSGISTLLSSALMKYFYEIDYTTGITREFLQNGSPVIRVIFENKPISPNSSFSNVNCRPVVAPAPAPAPAQHEGQEHIEAEQNPA